MEEQQRSSEMVHHFEHLAADADALMEMLTRQHEATGDLHPEVLPKAARLQTNLHAVLHAFTKREHLAMGADDVWRALGREHRGREV